MTKFWSWHSTAYAKEMNHMKFRPAFNKQVKGHAKEYWRYAIKSTIFFLRKNNAKNSGSLRAKRQNQTVELSELYKIKQFNDWIN